MAIDLQKGVEPSVQKIETPQYYSFKRISGSIESITAQLKQLRKEASPKPLMIEIVYDYTPGVNIHEALLPVLEKAPFEVVSWKINRNNALGADSFSDETLESVDVLDDEEIFRRLLMSKIGITEMNDDIKKDFENYLPLFRQVVEEVKSEEA